MSSFSSSPPPKPPNKKKPPVPGSSTGSTSGGDEFSNRVQSAMRGRSNAISRGTPPKQEKKVTNGPVGDGPYLVKAGECISSIAKQTGHFWETIWNDGANSAVKEARKNPNVLLPGDRLTIPEFQEKQESIAPEARHRFKRKGEPSKFTMKFYRDGKPRGGVKYEISIDGRKPILGSTDPDGQISVPIPGDAHRATLKLGEPPDLEIYDLNLGTIQPISELAGVQMRLNNLGFEAGPADGIWRSDTANAIALFQEENDMAPTGKLDETTRAAILEAHGS